MIDLGNNVDVVVHLLNARLLASEARLRNILECSPDAFIIVDYDSVIQFANRTAAAMFGIPESAMLGQRFGFPLAPGSWTDIEVIGSNGEKRIAEMRVGETEWGGRSAHIAVLRDVTERSRAEHALHESENRLALAMETAMLGFWDVDLRTDRVTCNAKMFEMLGYRPKEFEPRRDVWRRMTHPDDLLRVQQAFADHLIGKTPTFQTEFRLLTKNGDWCWFRSQCEIVERDAEEGRPLRVVGVTENIKERKAVEEEVRHVAQHDPLTGLPNRALLYEFAERVLSSARRSGRRNGAAFLFVDLDRFKPINDTYGHDVGDAVLKEVAQRLAASVRGEDLVGRLGGDEFLIVLPHIQNGEDAAKSARHALRALEPPVRLNDLAVPLSASLGISLFPQDGSTAEELIKNADTAMYRAKERGPNNFRFFKQEFNERAAQAVRIESRLHRGLEQNEFVLFYQPVLDTETQALVGVEALLRWPAMDAAPEQFILVAETTGFMHTLGGWVLREACRQRAEWRASGMPAIPLSINVSQAQFRQKEFVRSVQDALAGLPLDPHDISVEVTENAVMRHVEDSASVLHSLKRMGLKVALDDFGTGYSNLSYLSRLPIDTLKLDKSFVQELDCSRANFAMIDSVIALGRALEMEVVAVGVESTQALSRLAARHCRRAQGFHLCRPLPAPAFEQWCRSRR